MGRLEESVFSFGSWVLCLMTTRNVCTDLPSILGGGNRSNQVLNTPCAAAMGPWRTPAPRCTWNAAFSKGPLTHSARGWLVSIAVYANYQSGGTTKWTPHFLIPFSFDWSCHTVAFVDPQVVSGWSLHLRSHRSWIPSWHPWGFPWETPLLR